MTLWRGKPVNTHMRVTNGSIESAQNSCKFSFFWQSDLTHLVTNCFSAKVWDDSRGTYAVTDMYNSNQDVFSNILNVSMDMTLKNNQEVPCHMVVYWFVHKKDNENSVSQFFTLGTADRGITQTDPTLTLKDFGKEWHNYIAIKRIQKFFLRPGGEVQLKANNGGFVVNSNSLTGSHRPEHMAGRTFGFVIRIMGTVGQEATTGNDDECGYMASKLHYVNKVEYKYQVSDVSQTQVQDRLLTFAADPDVIAQPELELFDQGVGNEV